jgi:hypothetical protein
MVKKVTTPALTSFATVDPLSETLKCLRGAGKARESVKMGLVYVGVRRGGYWVCCSCQCLRCLQVSLLGM